MKLIRDDSLYIQIRDLYFLSLNSMVIPFSLYIQLINRKELLLDNSKKYMFLKTTNKKDIESINKMEWILDFDELNSKV